MRRTALYYSSSGILLLGTVAWLDSVSAGSVSHSLFFFRGASERESSALSGLEEKALVYKIASQMTSGLWQLSEGVKSNLTLDNSFFDGSMLVLDDAKYEEILPSRTSGDSKQEQDSGAEGIVYNVAAQTSTAQLRDAEIEDHESVERRVIMTSGSFNARAIVGGRAGRDLRLRKGPRPTPVVPSDCDSNAVVSPIVHDYVGTVPTAAPLPLSDENVNHSRPAHRIPKSPSADIRDNNYYSYDDVDESAVIFDKDSVLMRKFFDMIETVSNALDAKLDTLSPLAELARRLPTQWELLCTRVAKLADESRKLSSLYSELDLRSWTSMRLSVASEFVRSHQAAVMFFALFVIMCLL